MASSAVTKAVKVPPPTSPFAELLRRSRFATFDSNIRQTYSTPPDAARRGEWGLKRPLAIKRRNSFIAVPAPFDSKAYYVDWSNAENEVRFVRRFEELEVSPQCKVSTPWHATLGSKNSANWLVDSEFSLPEEGPEVEEINSPVAERAEEKNKMKEELQDGSIPVSLEGLGIKGPGNYGARRQPPEWKLHLVPNIHAMSPKAFEKYLRKLRELRPQFEEYVKDAWEQEQKIRAEKLNRQQQSQEPSARHTRVSDAPDLITSAQRREKEYHRHFLQHHTASQLSDPDSKAIEQRPHQTGGLMYARLSALHSHLYAQPQPGIVLQGALRSRDHSPHYIGSLAGMTPIIERPFWGGKTPLLNTNDAEGIQRERLADSLAYMKVKPGSVIMEKPPKTVAPPRNSMGLESAHISSEAIVVANRDGDFSVDNPYRPGTPMYSGLAPAMNKSTLMEQEKAIQLKDSRRRYGEIQNRAASKIGGNPNSKAVLNILQTLLQTNHTKQK
ncbi:hypothetical protein Moror_7755 [Moniliophthora roreri MCA 2997]|uniref:Uncharacterized protein n=2 Tax=Moniliophthora roreri TaxID=221103 RepID=V2XCJ3_MONRO|nr:hypothetical protein Moror_7755 [Moniliophthora roreri MCA 2997]KAI3615159.1 hypothetical protein WG66_003575 [Moniliophthora roreri]